MRHVTDVVRAGLATRGDPCVWCVDAEQRERAHERENPFVSVVALVVAGKALDIDTTDVNRCRSVCKTQDDEQA
jgi:hypothetical protein